MNQATITEIFNIGTTEKSLLQQLPVKLYLINVEYFPTNETGLKAFAAHGYEVLHMQGTCHFPMLEHPKELNQMIERIIHQIAEVGLN